MGVLLGATLTSPLRNLCNLCIAKRAAAQIQDCNLNFQPSFVGIESICRLCFATQTDFRDRQRNKQEVLVNWETFHSEDRFKFKLIGSVEQGSGFRYESDIHKELIPKRSLRGQVRIRNDNPVIFTELSMTGMPFNGFHQMWWKSELTVSVNAPIGNYLLELYGKHDQPGPVLLQVLVNDKPVGILQFDRDDLSWESKCLKLHPIHWPNDADNKTTIRIRYVNDGGKNGDRDAAIAWLRLIPLLEPISTEKKYD